MTYAKVGFLFAEQSLCFTQQASLPKTPAEGSKSQLQLSVFLLLHRYWIGPELGALSKLTSLALHPWRSARLCSGVGHLRALVDCEISASWTAGPALSAPRLRRLAVGGLEGLGVDWAAEGVRLGAW